MTYIKNSAIAGADYNSLAGSTSDPAASSLAATNKAGYLWGVGYGDRGYGRTTPSVSMKSAGATVAREWDELRSVVQAIATWQNTSTVLNPPSSAFDQGAPIVAHERDAPSLNAYDLTDLISLLDTNRFNYQLANMALSSNVASTTRTTTWGGGAGSITTEMTVDFESENSARYFFNTGGEIRIGLEHPNTSTPIDVSWNTILSNLTISLKAKQTSRLSGSYGTGTSIGYYGLTSTFQTIYSGMNLGLGSYSVNDFYVEAKVNSVAGLNGGNGTSITLKIVLVDEQTVVGAVSAGTTVTLSHLRASSSISLAAPIVTLDAPFSGAPGGGSGSTISVDVTSTNNYVANTAKIPGYVAGSTNAVFNIIGNIGSASTGSFAFVVDTSWASTDTVTVNIASGVRIVGKGGKGADSSVNSGASGGPAFRAQRPITLTNDGIIGGGGGGGGGGAGGYISGGGKGADSYSPGGGGGGGRGKDNSLGGAPGPTQPANAAYAGQGGTISGPGAGGQGAAGGGYGGTGGALGSAGGQGGLYNTAYGWSQWYAASSGGAPGQAINGLANINNGTVPGTIFGGQS